MIKYGTYFLNDLFLDLIYTTFTIRKLELKYKKLI